MILIVAGLLGISILCFAESGSGAIIAVVIGVLLYFHNT
jgi:hypothetical protein